MIYTIKNEHLTVQIASHGAELVSARKGDCEYIWSGDKAYWDEHAPMMFPICGRFYGGKYTYNGKTYEMGLHGFARISEFTAEQESETCLHMTLTASENTLAQYPFLFVLTVTYRLDGDTLYVSANMRNNGESVMPAAFGAHPGFCVPLDGSGDFSDYYLEFSEECSPDALLLSGVCYNSGKKRGMLLNDGKRLPLSHSLFDEEGVFMHRVSDRVTLKSDCSERFVTLHYPDMPYLGIWQPAHSNAPFVCLEPWCSFVGYDNTIEDLSTKADMFRIRPGCDKTVRYSVLFG